MLFISAPFGNYLKFENTISVIGTYTLHPRPGRLKQIIKEELDRASEIKAERVVNFIKDHGDTHAELVQIFHSRMLVVVRAAAADARSAVRRKPVVAFV